MRTNHDYIAELLVTQNRYKKSISSIKDYQYNLF
jgi:hypothetical protein